MCGLWVVTKDACDVLEIGNPAQVLPRLDDDEIDVIILNDSVGRPNRISIINEAGLYTLV